MDSGQGVIRPQPATPGRSPGAGTPVMPSTGEATRRALVGGRADGAQQAHSQGQGALPPRLPEPLPSRSGGPLRGAAQGPGGSRGRWVIAAQARLGAWQGLARVCPQPLPTATRIAILEHKANNPERTSGAGQGARASKAPSEQGAKRAGSQASRGSCEQGVKRAGSQARRARMRPEQSVDKQPGGRAPASRNG